MTENFIKRNFPNASHAFIKANLSKEKVDGRSDACLHRVQFTVYGEVIGKPRMTRQDKWKKRPCVQRYWEFKERVKASCSLPEGADVMEIHINASIPMPKSWRWKKSSEMKGVIHRQTPDADNIIKAVMDSLLDQDSGVWKVSCEKRWCETGTEKIQIEIIFSK